MQAAIEVDNPDVVDQRGAPPPTTGSDDALMLVSMTEIKGQRLKMGLILAAIGCVAGAVIGYDLGKTKQRKITAAYARSTDRRTSRGARQIGQRQGTRAQRRLAGGAR